MIMSDILIEIIDNHWHPMFTLWFSKFPDLDLSVNYNSFMGSLIQYDEINRWPQTIANINNGVPVWWIIRYKGTLEQHQLNEWGDGTQSNISYQTP